MYGLLVRLGSGEQVWVMSRSSLSGFGTFAGSRSIAIRHSSPWVANEKSKVIWCPAGFSRRRFAAAALVVNRTFFLAGVAFIVGSIMDTLDGRYSRMSGKGTPFGAFLDSTLDRLEEGIVLTAVAAYFASRHDQVAVAAVVVAVLGSLMVSYTRARAEALGVECKVGLATRPVRVVILSIGLVFARGASLGNFSLLAPAVYVLAGLSLITVCQRIWHVRKELNAQAAAES